MELIRTKRATTSGQNGGPGQPKSKYRKRSVSPVLSRALRSARCAGVSDLVADFFGLRIVLLIPTSLSRSLLALARLLLPSRIGQCATGHLNGFSIGGGERTFLGRLDGSCCGNGVHSARHRRENVIHVIFGRRQSGAGDLMARGRCATRVACVSAPPQGLSL